MKVDCEKLYQDAHEFGMKCAKDCLPQGMTVIQRSNPLDDSSEIVKSWKVPSGPCGFAWVNIKPANSRFAKYLLSNRIARRDTYEGGVCLWVSYFGQSIQKKEAYARGFASIISKAGVKCYASSRLD